MLSLLLLRILLYQLRHISLHLSLTRKAFGRNPLDIIIRTFSRYLKIHEPLDADHPAPLLADIPGTEIVHVIVGSNLESRRYHFVFLPNVTLVDFDLSEIDILDDFLESFVGKDEDKVHG